MRSGLNYLGICAGAILAGENFDLTGVRFRFYSAEDRGIRKEVVATTSADGSTLDQYWEDGPQLSGWGAVWRSIRMARPQSRRAPWERDGCCSPESILRLRKAGGVR